MVRVFHSLNLFVVAARSLTKCALQRIHGQVRICTIMDRTKCVKCGDSQLFFSAQLRQTSHHTPHPDLHQLLVDWKLFLRGKQLEEIKCIIIFSVSDHCLTFYFSEL